MPISSVRKKTTLTTTVNGSSTVSRPSLIDTMLLTSTPLRRSPGIQSIGASTRSATNLTLQQIFKEKNQTYEDMQLLNLTKNMNKKDKRKEKKTSSQNSMNKSLKKRSKTRKTVIAEQEEDDDEGDSTDNEQEIQIRKKPTPKKRKTKQLQSEEPILKKLRQTNLANKKRITKMPIGKTSAGSSDTCTTVDEENEETRLIQQSKLYIEGPGIRPNYKKIIEHNNQIGERIQSLRSHQQIPTNLPSPILSRSTNAKQDIIVVPTQTTSPVKIKTASRITFALPPPQSVSPVPTTVFDSTHPPSPQMPPTTTATSIDTQTELFPNTITQEQHCQTQLIDTQNQSIQTELNNNQLISIGIQYDVEHIPQQHLLCRDLTVCTCVEQLVKTRQFLVDTTNQLQSTIINRPMKPSKQTMTIDEYSSSSMVLAKSSLKAEQQK